MSTTMIATTARPPARRPAVHRRGAVAPYRRRRVGAATFALALVGLGAAGREGLADRGGEPAGGSAPATAPLSYTVQPGDTLWEIASRRAGAGVAEYVDALVSLNGGSALTPGQVLRLP